MKKVVFPLVCVLLTLLLLWGCTAARSEEESGPVLWFAGDTSQWTSTTTAVGSESYGGAMSVDGLMSALLAGPSGDSALLSLFPAGTRLLGWSMEKDGSLWVNLSGEYAVLTGVDLTLADYCITLTLEQLTGVEQVFITVEGRGLGDRYRQDLSGDQVIFSGAEEQPVEVSAVLYFPRSAGRGLGFENRTFQMTEDDVLVEIVTQALLDGPESQQLASLIPEDTHLLSVRLEDGVCYANFSAAFVEQMPSDEDSQTLIIYSLVDTLGNLDSVGSVVLQIEGIPLERYGAVEFGEGLEPDFGLVEPHG